jgi:hypothetical protein
MSVYKIWSNSRLLEYGNYHPHFQGKTLDVYEKVETPKKGDYGVFRGPWNSWELRSLSFTKKGKLNGGQKRHAHYFVRKRGTEYFPFYGEIAPLCIANLETHLVMADTDACYNFFSSEKEVTATLTDLEKLCADFGVILKWIVNWSRGKVRLRFFRSIEHCERRTFWNVTNVDIDSWLKGLHSFAPAIEETVRQELIEREVAK